MKKLILILIIGYGAFTWYQNNSEPKGSYGESHNQLIMYSLTTCGFCKQKARELRKERISFKEYFIDKNKKRQEELQNKLSKAGFKPKSYGTPIFDVHGIMMPNNPDIEIIRAILNKT